MASKVKGKKAPKVRAGRTSTSRISSKNQVTIPVEVLRNSNLLAGDEVEFIIKDNVIEIKPIVAAAEKQHKIMALAGDMTQYYQGFDLGAERASWDRV